MTFEKVRKMNGALKALHHVSTNLWLMAKIILLFPHVMLGTKFPCEAISALPVKSNIPHCHLYQIVPALLAQGELWVFPHSHIKYRKWYSFCSWIIKKRVLYCSLNLFPTWNSESVQKQLGHRHFFRYPHLSSFLFLWLLCFSTNLETL